MTSRSQWFYVLGLTMVFPSLLIGIDLVLTFLCERVPLSWYLGACAIGVVTGPLIGAKLQGDGGLRRLLRGFIGVAVMSGVIGAAWMTLGSPPSWNSKCAWRYCGRVLGPNLNRSPFPVGMPSCSELHMCANEYPYSQDENRELLTLIGQRRCEAP